MDFSLFNFTIQFFYCLIFAPMKKAGILGGGQLGRMLLQEAANYPVETWVLENDASCPAAHLCHHFIKGDITKQFYQQQGIPTSDFIITQNAEDLQQHASFLPAVHKLATGGYDGRGVQIIKSTEDITKGFNAPAVLEKMVDIKKEIAVMIAVNKAGETAIYSPVDMVFDQNLNLLSYQMSPATLPEKILWKAEAIALKVVKELKSPGIFAVELFTDFDDKVWVNETAPRVHNSGHHSIEACYSSQFDMLWRVLLDYPLGNTDHIMSAAIVNILGAEGFTGPAIYEGLNEILAMDNVFVHLYGKTDTKPGRKMGHITILSNEKQELLHKANQIKHTLFVKSK